MTKIHRQNSHQANRHISEVAKPHRELKGDGIGSMIVHAAKKLNKLAIPVIIGEALMRLPTADAGPAAFCACMAACMGFIAALTGPFVGLAAPQCAAACSASAFLPTP